MNHNVLWDLTFKTASVFRTLSLSVPRQELDALWDTSWAVSEETCVLKVWKTVCTDTGIRGILFFYCLEKGKLSIKVRDRISWIWKVQPKGENSLLEKTHFVLALPESIKINPYFFPGDANSWGWKLPICKTIPRRWASKPCYHWFQHIPLLQKTGATFTKTRDYVKVFLFNEVMRTHQEALV